VFHKDQFLDPYCLVYSIYSNDLPKILIGNSIPIPFADGVNVVTTNWNIVGFQSDIKAVFEQLNSLIWTYYH
jgi:hypothetical protein